MTLAAVDWLSISINLLLVIFVFVALLMSLLILMQRPKQEGLGAAFGSGMTDQMFGARTTNVLQKGTVYLASLFFLLSIVLAILYSKRNDYSEQSQVKEIVAEEAAAETTAPVEELPKSLSDELEAATGGEPEGETPAPAVEPESAEPGAGEGPTPPTEPATEPAEEEEAPPEGAATGDPAPAPEADADAPAENGSPAEEGEPPSTEP